MDWFGISFTLFAGGCMGGALIWHFKEFFVSAGRRFVSWFRGAQYMAAKAQADVAVLEAKLAAAKAAVKS
jgi:hypothetical protein